MNKSPNYLWETLVMIASFLLLWVWFFANRSGAVLPVIHVLLAAAVIALVFIFIRRLKRVRDAMNETQKPPGTPGSLPFMPTQFGSSPTENNGATRNGKNGKH